MLADRGVGDGEVGAGMLIEDVDGAREAGLDATRVCAHELST